MNTFEANWQIEQQKPSEAIDSVLLIGQSNMCGRGILWHQGESDSKNPDDVARYKERFFAMLHALKKELGLGDDLPVILGELSLLGQPRWPLVDRATPCYTKLRILRPALASSLQTD